MRIGDKNVFKDPHKKNNMLSLRRQGWTYLSLAFIYGVDHTSIYYECKKYKIANPVNTVDFSPKSIVNLLGISLPKDKNYSDYLREAGYERLSQRYLKNKNIYFYE
jgi:hypothetical protein